MKDLVISGTGSGIGKYLHEKWGGTAITRNFSESQWEELKVKGAKTIVHCAFNSSLGVNENGLYQYISDNIFLTKRLAEIPHEKFVFFSTVNVYPKNSQPFSEDTEIVADKVEGIYAVSKLISEAIVKKHAKNPLILRCAGLLGKTARLGGNIMRLLNEKEPALSLTRDSQMNYVLYFDVADFISLALSREISGTYNIASSENISIAELSAALKKNPVFGSHRYDVGTIDNSKAVEFFPRLNRTSKEAVEEFAADILKI